MNNNMQIDIIRADASHAAVIAGIGHTAFSEAFGYLFKSKQELDEYLAYTYAVKKISNSIRKDHNTFFLALVNGKPVGFVKLKKYSLNSLIDSVSQMELQKIYVLKEYHGVGAGEGLMKAAIGFARKLDLEYLWLDTYVGNARGINFYEKHGFDVCGRHYFTIGSQTFEYYVMTRVLSEDGEAAASRVWNLHTN